LRDEESRLTGAAPEEHDVHPSALLDIEPELVDRHETRAARGADRLNAPAHDRPDFHAGSRHSALLDSHDQSSGGPLPQYDRRGECESHQDA
jgi:hypothetical protein